MPSEVILMSRKRTSLSGKSSKLDLRVVGVEFSENIRDVRRFGENQCVINISFINWPTLNHGTKASRELIIFY